MTKPMLRCAVYTRKSSDEGLDQSFNSLDAQREAGQAYVLSQAHEGWKLLPTCYDDGGFSGGSMERPGLQKLLADVEAGRVDVVVVYKIDRLTRSLADFARIVEAFDKRSVSFVSVTQAFNTTSSMGRLTLNVLLSFAQFEREVTGERIRDKIAASKAKGLWMGGLPPLGYDLPDPGSRMLKVNEVEADLVRAIFQRYLALGSVHALQRELRAEGVLSKRHVTRRGTVHGGVPLSRGALFHLLRNRIYLGEIVHKDRCFPGEHEGIVDAELFGQVQTSLDDNARRRTSSTEQRMIRAPLAGKLFDENGAVMTPTFTTNRTGRSYRYYVSASLQAGGARDQQILQRIPAREIEELLSRAIAKIAPRHEDPLALTERVALAARGIELTLCGDHAAAVGAAAVPGTSLIRATRKATTIMLDVTLPLRGGKRMLVRGDVQPARIDPVLVAALRKAHRMLGRDPSGHPLIAAAPTSPYERRLLRLAFLDPAIQRDIIAGKQPAALNLEALMSAKIPLAWSQQREALGWAR